MTVATLPTFIKPMLAETGKPFDSDEHLFEVKWDGIRAGVYVERDGYRILGRRGSDFTDRYPEFEPFRELAPGTILDGEIVVLVDGKPSFRQVLTREQARSPRRVKTLADVTPAHFIVFDQLYRDYEPIMSRPLTERRDCLLTTTRDVIGERLAVSEGVIGPGREFFSQIVARDMEGVVAKRLSARYSPGRRSDAWIKFRKSSAVLCAIVGYVPDGDDFESLILAADEEGMLRYVGRVGTGFDADLRARINALLRSHATSQPMIPCPVKGRWLQPGLYCSVRFLEWSHNRELREPVFEELIPEESPA